LVPLLNAGDPALKLEQLSRDAGYDSELNHAFARLACNIRSLIPAKAGRPDAGPPKGRFRRQMREQLSSKTKRSKCGYAQRVQAETSFSTSNGARENLSPHEPLPTNVQTAIDDHHPQSDDQLSLESFLQSPSHHDTALK